MESINFKFIFLFLLNINFIVGQSNDLATIATKYAEKGVDISYLNGQYLNNEKIRKNGLNHLTDEGKQDKDEDNLDDNDDLDLGKRERNEKRNENIKKYVNREFNLMINKNKELIAFLSDLWQRKKEIRKKENNQKELDIEDELKTRFVDVLRERISKISNENESKQLNELLTKWSSDNTKSQSKNLKNDNDDEDLIIENFENKIKSLIGDKELTKQQQKTKLLKLIKEIKKFNQLNSLQRAEKTEKFKEKINKSIKDLKLKLNEKIDELKKNVQNLLEGKFDQIDKNFDEKKLKNTLNELEIKLNDQIEDRKSKRDLELNKIKDRMIRLIDSDLIENDLELKLDELKQLVNSLDKENKIIELKDSNPDYLKLNNLIQQIPNTSTIELDQIDEQTNNEQIKIEKIKDKLKLIEKDIVDYSEINKDHKEEIEENLAKFNDNLQLNKKISTGLLIRLARLVDNEEIKEEIKEVIKDVINFAKVTNRNLLDVETDLMTLINEIESNSKTLNSKFNLDNYQTNLNINKPRSRLLLREPNLENYNSVFNPKAFGLAVAVFFGTLILIALSMLACKRIRRRRNYERV